MNSIMIIEDEKNIRELIKKSLIKKGYGVTAFENAESAISQFHDYKPDIVILDIMLPGMDGFESCEKLRGLDSDLGIIMLTAKSQNEDIINGLSKGADDYIKKPFNLWELFARVESVLRKVKRLRSVNINKMKIYAGKYSLDICDNTLQYGSQSIELTNIEVEIVKILITNTNTTISRDYILDNVWGESYFGSYKIVDVNIQRIRKKIMEKDINNPIETIRGRGYRWADQ